MNRPEAECTEQVVEHLCYEQNCDANSMNFVMGSQVLQNFLQLINKRSKKAES